MSSAINGRSNGHRKQIDSPPISSSHTLTRPTLKETAKKIALVGSALLITGGILYFCACDRNEESWCVLKSNAQILSNMGLVAGFFRT